MDFVSPKKCPHAGASACPFLRNLSRATDFTFLGVGDSVPGDAFSTSRRGPIFADDDNFEVAFKVFHGENGVVPLAPCSAAGGTDAGSASRLVMEAPLEFTSSPATSVLFSPSFAVVDGVDVWDSPDHEASAEGAALSLSPLPATAAPFASLGISVFGGGGGPFGFDAFRTALEARKAKVKAETEKRQREELQKAEEQAAQDQDSLGKHEATGDDWLATGKCPIARSFRAFNHVVPALAAAFKPPAGVKYVCPPAIVAMRAALSKHPVMKALRPQALPIRVLAIGTMGLFLNVPLGAWREHLVKFSPQWILVVHASVPFVAMLRKAVLMPKYAMAFTIAASIVGQTLGSRLERRRLASVSETLSETGGVTSTLRLKQKSRKRGLGFGVRGLDTTGGDDSFVAFDCKLVPGTESCYSARGRNVALHSSGAAGILCGTSQMEGGSVMQVAA